MPWRFEERTRLVPRHGLSWRHLKASTQSTNKTRWNSAAIPSQPPHNKQILHLSHPLQFTLSALTRNACAVSFNRGRSKAEKIPPNSRDQEPKAHLSPHLVLLFRGNLGVHQEPQNHPPTAHAFWVEPLCEAKMLWGALGHRVQAAGKRGDAGLGNSPLFPLLPIRRI